MAHLSELAINVVVYHSRPNNFACTKKKQKKTEGAEILPVCCQNYDIIVADGFGSVVISKLPFLCMQTAATVGHSPRHR